MCLAASMAGIGFGNATSLPPLIAQVEFVKDDVMRVVALIVGIIRAGEVYGVDALIDAQPIVKRTPVLRYVLG